MCLRGMRCGTQCGGTSEVYHCARACAQLRGYGMSADAHHITAPPPDGAGAALAMRNALRDGGVAPADVAYVNAHGTGTPQGDVAELRAIARVFGGAAPPGSGDAGGGGGGAGSEQDSEAKVRAVLRSCTASSCFCVQGDARWLRMQPCCMKDGQWEHDLMCGIACVQGAGGIVRAVEQLLHLDAPGSSGGEDGSQNRQHGGLPFISSTKGATGHLLGAAGMRPAMTLSQSAPSHAKVSDSTHCSGSGHGHCRGFHTSACRAPVTILHQASGTERAD